MHSLPSACTPSNGALRGVASGEGGGRPGGDDAELNRVRYRYRLLLHIFALEHDLISPAGFDEVATELGQKLDFANVPKREKAEVLAAFAAHKDEGTEGYVAGGRRG